MNALKFLTKLSILMSMNIYKLLYLNLMKVLYHGPKILKLVNNLVIVKQGVKALVAFGALDKTINNITYS